MQEEKEEEKGEEWAAIVDEHLCQQGSPGKGVDALFTIPKKPVK